MPSKLTKIKSSSPWFFNTLNKLKLKRDRFCRKWKNYGALCDQLEFRHYKSLYQKAVRKAKENYIDKILTPNVDLDD